MSNTPPQSAKEERTGSLIKRHYLQDLSVESPSGRVDEGNIAAVLSATDGHVNASKMATENQHLVTIYLTITAKLAERVVFLMEMTYCVEVELHNLSEEVGQFALAVSVPEAIFPAIQELVKINGSYAGYPEMDVSMPNFHAIFFAKQAALKAAN